MGKKIFLILIFVLLSIAGCSANKESQSIFKRERIFNDNVAILESGEEDRKIYKYNEWKVVGKDGKVIFEQGENADYISKFSSGIACIVKDGKYGFIDKKGTIIIKPQFDDADNFREGLAPVEIDGKWGAIDESGEIVIEPKYYYLGDFSDGYAIYRENESDTELGYIDKNEKQLSDFKFSNTFQFAEGVAIAVKDGKWCILNKEGNIIETEFTFIYPFNDGIACVRDKSNKYGFIDKKGNVIIEPKFDSHMDSSYFSDDLIPVNIDDKYGYINKKDETIIDPQFDEAGIFNDGLAYVCINDKYGYINKKGEIIIEPQFDEAKEFNNGLAAVSTNGKFGIIDKEGSFVINPLYDKIE